MKDSFVGMLWGDALCRVFLGGALWRTVWGEMLFGGFFWEMFVGRCPSEDALGGFFWRMHFGGISVGDALWRIFLGDALGGCFRRMLFRGLLLEDALERIFWDNALGGCSFLGGVGREGSRGHLHTSRLCSQPPKIAMDGERHLVSFFRESHSGEDPKTTGNRESIQDDAAFAKIWGETECFHGNTAPGALPPGLSDPLGQ